MDMSFVVGHELWKICQPQAEILSPFLGAQTLEAYEFSVHFHSFI